MTWMKLELETIEECKRDRSTYFMTPMEALRVPLEPVKIVGRLAGLVDAPPDGDPGPDCNAVMVARSISASAKTPYAPEPRIVYVRCDASAEITVTAMIRK